MLGPELLPDNMVHQEANIPQDVGRLIYHRTSGACVTRGPELLPDNYFINKHQKPRTINKKKTKKMYSWLKLRSELNMI